MSDFSDPNEIEKRIKNFVYPDGSRIFSINDYTDYKIQLLIDEKVAPGRFRPSNLAPGIYYANSLTISAVRKNLFTTDTDTDALEKTVICSSCNRDSDEQFWSRCPYCGKQIKK